MTKQRISFEWEGYLIWMEEEPLEPGSKYLDGPKIHIQNKADREAPGITITPDKLFKIAEKVDVFKSILSILPTLSASVIDDE